MDVSPDRTPDPLAAWKAATQGGPAGPPRPPDQAPPSDAAQPRARPGRTHRLVIAAGVPWVAVALLAAALVDRSPAAPPVTPTATPVPAVTHAPAPPAGGLDPRLAAAAVLAVRMSAPDDLYVDTAVAEGMDTVAGAAVVTVAAAVLDRDDGAWTGPRHVRFAVPFSSDQSDHQPDHQSEHQSEPVALAAPWILPGGGPSRAEPAATPVDDLDLRDTATATLRSAGYRAIATPRLRRHEPLPDILAVHVWGRAPGETEARDHVIWLDAAGSRVLGAPATTASAQLPAPIPAEAP